MHTLKKLNKKEASSHRMGKRIVFSGKEKVELEYFRTRSLGENEVLVKIELSLMSTGTENIIFNRLFDTGTHWDRWVKYPFYPGYSAVGIIEEIGDGVRRFLVGDRIATRLPHGSHGVVAENDGVRIPQEISPENAVWFALAKIAFHGVLAANISLGDSVLIVGAGPIGQMMVRWARAAGAATIQIIDPSEWRLAFARTGGATSTIARTVSEAKDEVLEGNNGILPKIVVDTTGNAAVFSSALELADEFGTIVILGDTGRPTEQRLTGDVIKKGLRIVGAHDNHSTLRWQDTTIVEFLFELINSGRFSLEGLNTHWFRPPECNQAYKLTNTDRANSMGVIFDWR